MNQHPPRPMPGSGKIRVLDIVVADIVRLEHPEIGQDRVIRDMTQGSQDWVTRHWTVAQTHDGIDSLEAAYREAIDLTIQLCKALVEGYKVLGPAYRSALELVFTLREELDRRG